MDRCRWGTDDSRLDAMDRAGQECRAKATGGEQGSQPFGRGSSDANRIGKGILYLSNGYGRPGGLVLNALYQDGSDSKSAGPAASSTPPGQRRLPFDLTPRECRKFNQNAHVYSSRPESKRNIPAQRCAGRATVRHLQPRRRCRRTHEKAIRYACAYAGHRLDPLSASVQSNRQ
jgi:hypothetical protein